MNADYSSPRPVRVVLADSDALYRERIQEMFQAEPDLWLLEGACDIAGAPLAVETLSPDILLLSASSDAKQTISILDRINRAPGSAKVILLVPLENQDFFVRAVRVGCRGILHRDSSPELLVKSIRKVSEGELWLDRATTAQVLRQFTEDHPPQRPKERDSKNSPLSPREREIVGLVIQGYKNRELAERLTISEQTVKNHMHNIFDKLGVSDRLELTLYSIHNNLLRMEG